MSKPRQTQHFAEIEYCLQNYFNSQLAPVMKEAQTYLTQKQVEEIGAYHASTAGVLRSLANGANGMPDDSLPYLRQTGEWNSKTTEDYVAMCRERIAATPETVEDLSLLAGEWRNAVVAEIGREQYEELSKELGGDLAFAYVDYRVEQMMVDRMVKEQMPKSSVEYVLRKGMEGSLFGFADSLMRSPLQQEIAARGEAAYNPSTGEKWAGRGVSLAACRCRGYRRHRILGGTGRNGGLGSRFLRCGVVHRGQGECRKETAHRRRLHQPCRVRCGG